MVVRSLFAARLYNGRARTMRGSHTGLTPGGRPASAVRSTASPAQKVSAQQAITAGKLAVNRPQVDRHRLPHSRVQLRAENLQYRSR